MNLYGVFKLRMIFYVIISFIAFFVIIFGYYGFLRYQINTPLNANDEEIVFTIEKGEGVKKIAANLEKADLIRGAFYFEMYVWFQSVGSKMQAGEYSLSSGLNIKEIAGKFMAGDAVKNEISVTFPEGFTLSDTENRLRESGFLEIDISKLEPELFESRFPFLRDIGASNLEGFLFPDTYKFDKNWGSEEIVVKILENFNRKITIELSQEIEKQGRTLFEIITMASLIEREVRTYEDKKIASGVLWKRLDVGMPLQVDASIVFLTGKKTGQVTYDDLKINSPYNTYLNVGLPPGPISNPGLESIMAAIYPSASDYWFYISKPNGETVFSVTFREHNEAINKYLRK